MLSTAFGLPSDSKIERFGRAILRIDEGQVLVPVAAAWLEKFLYEVSDFPNISDDDQVKSMSRVVANFETAISQAQFRNAEMADIGDRFKGWADRESARCTEADTRRSPEASRNSPGELRTRVVG